MTDKYLNPSSGAQASAASDARRTLDQARADCDVSTERTFHQLHTTLGGLEDMLVTLNTDIAAYEEVLERVRLMYDALTQQRDLCLVMINGTRDAIDTFSARPEYLAPPSGQAYVQTVPGMAQEDLRRVADFERAREQQEEQEKTAKLQAMQAARPPIFPTPKLDAALTDTLRTAMDNVDKADTDN